MRDSLIHRFQLHYEAIPKQRPSVSKLDKLCALANVLLPISAIEVVQSILEAVLLRREKTTKDRDGKPIVQLPPKTINIEYLDLTPNESKLYDAIYKNVKKDYESFNSSGLITKNITSMLARIMTYASDAFPSKRKAYGLPFQSTSGSMSSRACQSHQIGSGGYGGAR